MPRSRHLAHTPISWRSGRSSMNFVRPCRTYAEQILFRLPVRHRYPANERRRWRTKTKRMPIRCNQFELGKEVHKLDCILAKPSFRSPDSCDSAKMSAIEQLIPRSEAARYRGTRARVFLRESRLPALPSRLVRSVELPRLKHLLTGVRSPKSKTRMLNRQDAEFSYRS